MKDIIYVHFLTPSPPYMHSNTCTNSSDVWQKSTTRQAKQLHPPTRETILSHLHPFPLLVPLHLPHSPFCAAPSVHVLSHRGSQTWRSGCTCTLENQNSTRFILTLQTLMVPRRSAEQNNIISRNKQHKSSNSSRAFLPKPGLARENTLLKVTSKRNRKGCYLYVQHIEGFCFATIPPPPLKRTQV